MNQTHDPEGRNHFWGLYTIQLGEGRLGNAIYKISSSEPSGSEEKYF